MPAARKWGELDRTAKANLDPCQLRRFFEYKEELRLGGHAWSDAYEILSGFLWDETEEPYDPDEDDEVVE